MSKPGPKSPNSKEALKNLKKSAEKKRRMGLIEESFVSIVYGSFSIMLIFTHNVGFPISYFLEISGIFHI